jgi:hypothetical protein
MHTGRSFTAMICLVILSFGLAEGRPREIFLDLTGAALGGSR